MALFWLLYNKWGLEKKGLYGELNILTVKYVDLYMWKPQKSVQKQNTLQV